MALFTESLIDETIAQVRRRYQSLGEALGDSTVDGRVEENGGSGDGSALREDLTLLVRVANGELSRTAGLSVMDRVESALGAVLEVLLGNALNIPASIPEPFWQTDIGIVASRVRWWLSVDDLVTISNAAALAFGENTQANRMRIARAIESGLLEWVPDPSVANPQKNRRVLRPQVERLRDQRRLPEPE